jgi:hypothetical protein
LALTAVPDNHDLSKSVTFFLSTATLTYRQHHGRPWMPQFDYTASAELFISAGRSGLRYRRFASAADAIRFAIETLPANALLSARLDVEDQQFDAKQIRVLYDSALYPLTRKG